MPNLGSVLAQALPESTISFPKIMQEGVGRDTLYPYRRHVSTAASLARRRRTTGSFNSPSMHAATSAEWSTANASQDPQLRPYALACPIEERRTLLDREWAFDHFFAHRQSKLPDC